MAKTVNQHKIYMLKFVMKHGGGLPESIENRLVELIDNDDETIDCRYRAMEMLLMQYKMGLL